MNKRYFFLCIILAAGALSAAEPPQAEITNGQVKVKLYLPDAENGFYRGTRFDWAGTIASAEANGHTYFAPWFVRTDPTLRDIDFDPAAKGYAAGRASANLGPVEEFRTALGYADAPVGGTFIKLGVGVLRKPQEERYGNYNPYEIVNGGKRSVRKGADWIEFVHDLTDPSSGYGYLYTKTVRLTKGKSELVLEHSFRNTGQKLIETDVYNHNFITIDGQPTGPDFVIRFPFEIKEARDKEGYAETRGKDVVYLRAIEGNQRVMVPIAGFGDSAKDYDIRVENTKIRAGVRIVGDRPITRVSVWAITPVRSPEPNINVRVEPGSEFTWRIAYEFYNIP